MRSKPDSAPEAASEAASEPAPRDPRAYAELFVWVRRNLSMSDDICHAGARAGMEAAERGEDPQQAAREAARVRGGHGWRTQADEYTRAYALWYDWARKHRKGTKEAHHRAAAAAMAALDAGGDTQGGVEAAQRALEHQGF